MPTPNDDDLKQLAGDVLKKLTGESSTDFTAKPAVAPNLPQLAKALSHRKRELLAETPKPKVVPVCPPPPSKPAGPKKRGM